MLKWIRVFKAARHLVKVVGDATEDSAISSAEMSQIMKAMWAVIHAYQGK